MSFSFESFQLNEEQMSQFQTIFGHAPEKEKIELLGQSLVTVPQQSPEELMISGINQLAQLICDSDSEDVDSDVESDSDSDNSEDVDSGEDCDSDDDDSDEEIEQIKPRKKKTRRTGSTGRSIKSLNSSVNNSQQSTGHVIYIEGKKFVIQ